MRSLSLSSVQCTGDTTGMPSQSLSLLFLHLSRTITLSSSGGWNSSPIRLPASVSSNPSGSSGSGARDGSGLCLPPLSSSSLERFREYPPSLSSLRLSFVRLSSPRPDSSSPCDFSCSSVVEAVVTEALTCYSIAN